MNIQHTYSFSYVCMCTTHHRDTLLQRAQIITAMTCCLTKLAICPKLCGSSKISMASHVNSATFSTPKRFVDCYCFFTIFSIFQCLRCKRGTGRSCAQKCQFQRILLHLQVDVADKLHCVLCTVCRAVMTATCHNSINS